MAEANYTKDSLNAEQIITVAIDADRSKVFDYLSTTSGISQWFPELEFRDVNNEKTLLFDLGDGRVQEMEVLELVEDQYIAFEWGGGGKVEILLKDTDENTKEPTELELKETLPLDFGPVSQDFTGWYFQVGNIKSISETGTVNEMDMSKFEEVKKEINDQLFL